jgi:DNA-binding CsgD family transcriptional regulator
MRLAGVINDVFCRSDVTHGALLFQKSDGHYKLGAGSACFPSDLLSMCEMLAEKNRHPGLIVARNRQTPFSISSGNPETASMREVPEFLELVSAANFKSFYFLPLRDSEGNLFVSAIASRERKLRQFELRLIHSYCFDGMERVTAETGRKKDAHALLTRRERECLIAAARGYTEKQSAQMLSISPCTVHAHLTSCKRKLGANSKLNTIIKGLKLGEIMPAAL